MIEITSQMENISEILFNNGYNDCGNAIRKAIRLLKEQDDCIRILTSDLEDLQKEHEKLLDKKIPLITQGQEVVLCKDCVYWDKGHTEECINSDSVCFYNGWCKPDWFCADGERKSAE